MIQKIYDFTFISEIKQAKIKQILAFRIIRVFSFRDYSIYIYIYRSHSCIFNFDKSEQDRIASILRH